MLISLTEWAEKVGIEKSVARRKAEVGTVPAFKIGRNWVIEEDTPNLDRRFKENRSPNYEGYGYKKKEV